MAEIVFFQARTSMVRSSIHATFQTKMAENPLWASEYRPQTHHGAAQ